MSRRLDTTTDISPKPRKAVPGQKAEERFVDLIQKWYTDPVAFVKEALKADPDKWQVEALYAIVSNDRIAIKSGHGVGKTAFNSWLILWWLVTHYPCRIPCTAPTASQLEDTLWPEVRKWAMNLPPFLKSQIEITSHHIKLASAPSQSFAVSKTASKDRPEALQGFHEENLLFLIDEASGVPDIVFETAQGSLSTKGAKIVMTGNPTRATGYFHNSFFSDRWYKITVSAIDAKQASKEFPEDIIHQYGRDSNVYRVRVLGEFPTGDDDGVIPLALAEEAMWRDMDRDTHAKVIWGLDVARFGDDRTVLCKRQGMNVTSLVSWQNKDIMQTAYLVADEYKKLQAHFSNELPVEVIVDVIGMGAGVADRLRELGLPVVECNVSESPSSKDKFMRLRDELWWNVREWLETKNAKLPNDEELINELATPRYSIPNGKIVIERKSDLKKRGLRSPDKADALCLTFAGYAANQVATSVALNKIKQPSSDWIV